MSGDSTSPGVGSSSDSDHKSSMVPSPSISWRELSGGVLSSLIDSVKDPLESRSDAVSDRLIDQVIVHLASFNDSVAKADFPLEFSGLAERALSLDVRKNLIKAILQCKISADDETDHFLKIMNLLTQLILNPELPASYLLNSRGYRLNNFILRTLEHLNKINAQITITATDEKYALLSEKLEAFLIAASTFSAALIHKPQALDNAEKLEISGIFNLMKNLFYFPDANYRTKEIVVKTLPTLLKILENDGIRTFFAPLLPDSLRVQSILESAYGIRPLPAFREEAHELLRMLRTLRQDPVASYEKKTKPQDPPVSEAKKLKISIDRDEDSTFDDLRKLKAPKAGAPESAPPSTGTSNSHSRGFTATVFQEYHLTALEAQARRAWNQYCDLDLGRTETKESKGYFGLLTQGKAFLKVSLSFYREISSSPADIAEIEDHLKIIQRELKRTRERDYPGITALS